MSAPQTHEDDFYLGKYVLEHNLVSREALLECLYESARHRRLGSRPGFGTPLGILLVSRGLINRLDLDRIMATKGAPGGESFVQSDAEVGRLLIGSGLLKQEELEECLQMQEEARKAGKVAPRLGELVVRGGYATDQQVMRVLEYQRRIRFTCRGCGIQVSSMPPPPGTRYRCKQCGGELLPAMTPSDESGSKQPPLQESTVGEEEQEEVDRAVAAYLKQKNLVRRDHLRDALQFQSEFARYGLVIPLIEILRRMGAVAHFQHIKGVDFTRLVKDADWKKQAIPGYKLLRRIASGGYASIYCAEAIFGGGQVAVKVLHPERARDQRALSRFEFEAELLRKLECPTIVRGIEYGADRGYHYIVMEQVEGHSLAQILSEGGPFSPRRALAATRQVAEALGYLHREGYLHRDVKTDNVIMDDAGRVKLIDLGFACSIPGPGERSQTVVGTTGYVSPEALRGEAGIKVGSDIYSLGVLLYALLSGFEPFAGASSEEVVCEQIEKSPPSPNLMTVLAPPSVIQFLKRMMHPDRSKRFPSMVEVLEAFDQLVTT